jgi:hypothetical protein
LFADFQHARQAIKITRRRQDVATGKASRQTIYAITSLTSAHATARELACLVRTKRLKYIAATSADDGIAASVMPPL